MSDKKTPTQPQDKPFERTVNFNEYLDKQCLVNLSASHELRATLKGWDELNIILENIEETLYTTNPASDEVTQHSRQIPGPMVLRLASTASIVLLEGYE